MMMTINQLCDNGNDNDTDHDNNQSYTCTVLYSHREMAIY